MDASTIMLLPYVPFLRLKIGRKKGGGGRGRDAASVPSCSRGINKRDTHGQLGTNICRGFQAKMWLQHYATGISQAAEEVIKIALS